MPSIIAVIWSSERVFCSTLTSRSLHLLRGAKGGEEWRKKDKIYDVKKWLAKDLGSELRLRGI